MKRRETLKQAQEKSRALALIGRIYAGFYQEELIELQKKQASSPRRRKKPVAVDNSLFARFCRNELAAEDMSDEEVQRMYKDMLE